MSILKLKWGNLKLGDDTGIINMGPAVSCPSLKKGLCKTVKKGIRCYARKPEIQYKDHVLNYRKEQQAYWTLNSGEKIYQDIKDKINRRRKKTKWLRFNESGDFFTQDDVTKLSHIAKKLKKDGVTVYGYTARSDLNFKNVHFLVKGSDCNLKGKNTGKTIVITNEEIPDKYLLCPNDCTICSLCMQDKKINIAFIQH